MPAPVPIQIHHDDPTLMGSLAQASGNAQYDYANQKLAQQQALSEWQTQYAGWSSRLAQDKSIAQQQDAQRQQAGQFNQTMDFRQNEADTSEQDRQQANALQNAQRQAVLAQRAAAQSASEDTANGRLKVLQDRLTAQENGTLGSLKGRSKQDLMLVPAEGDINARQPGATATTDENGNVSINSPTGPKPAMVPLYQRKNSDYINSYPGIGDPERAALNRLNEAGASVDNLRVEADRLARQAKPPITVGMKDVQKAQAEINQMQAAAGSGRNGERAWLQNVAHKGDFMAQDRVRSASDSAIHDEFMQRFQYNANLADNYAPISNSSGRSPLGGNDPQLQQKVSQLPDAASPSGPSQAPQVGSKADFDALPRDTRYYNTVDGHWATKP